MMSLIDDILLCQVMGFCGLDDSLDPHLALLLSTKYPWIEWGILFRPDLEGTPRYASANYVKRLAAVNIECGSPMRLAGHLCGHRCQEVLISHIEYI